MFYNFLIICIPFPLGILWWDEMRWDKTRVVEGQKKRKENCLFISSSTLKVWKKFNNKTKAQKCLLTLTRQQVHLSTTMDFWLTGLVITKVEIFWIFGIFSEEQVTQEIFILNVLEPRLSHPVLSHLYLIIYFRVVVYIKLLFFLVYYYYF
jgi:hypothetical protein